MLVGAAASALSAGKVKLSGGAAVWGEDAGESRGPDGRRASIPTNSAFPAVTVSIFCYYCITMIVPSHQVAVTGRNLLPN